MKKVRVATLNLLFDEWRRAERLEVAVSEIKQLRPDVVMLQEASLSGGTPAKLKKLLPEYYQSLCPRDGRWAHTGQMVLSKQRPRAQEILRLSQSRAAQKVAINISGRPVNFVNLHLFFSPFRDRPRLKQVHRLLNFAGAPAVLAGDFNVPPGAKSLQLITQRFDSSYAHVHGREPASTYPTPLYRGPGLRHYLRRNALRTLGLLTDGHLRGWEGTIDYIFVEKGIKVSACQIAFAKPSTKDPYLYASDHYGLYADIFCR